ncbi:MAG: YceI family protein [Pseudomonadota bacterium]
MKFGRRTALLAAFLFAIPFAQAAEFNRLRPDGSTVAFVYRQMGVPVEGGFRRFGGSLSFDPARPQAAKAVIEVDLAGIDTGFAEGNEEAQGRLWFDTKNHPVARFVATSVKPLGGNRFEVAGRLSIKGRTREVKTPATFRQAGSSGVFEGAFILKRADYGIGEGVWADFDTVANEVEVRFRLSAVAAK